jgi:hypothetical protein
MMHEIMWQQGGSYLEGGEWCCRLRQRGPRFDKMNILSEEDYFLLSKNVKLFSQIKKM